MEKVSRERICASLSTTITTKIKILARFFKMFPWILNYSPIFIISYSHPTLFFLIIYLSLTTSHELVRRNVHFILQCQQMLQIIEFNYYYVSWGSCTQLPLHATFCHAGHHGNRQCLACQECHAPGHQGNPHFVFNTNFVWSMVLSKRTINIADLCKLN